MRIIGMVHLRTLPGYPQFENLDTVIDAAVADAQALVKGGADAILIENTDDDPHRKENGHETSAALTAIVIALKAQVDVPLGLCVLWNDYRCGLAVAAVTGCSFVRVPVFTEAIITGCGIIEANPFDVLNYRKQLGAEQVQILADVQVKHATLMTKRTIAESAEEAVNYGADGIIITGRETGDPPTNDDLAAARTACPRTQLFVGSGTSPENIASLGAYADGFIVGTALKQNGKVVQDRVQGLVKAAQTK